jgi:type IV pilus biogenesis protein CpaD/CtpE
MNRLILLPLFVLASCADPHEPINADFGNAVTTNMAAQIINPGPNTTVRSATVDGRRMNDAIERYRTGRVYPPIPAIEAVVKQGAAPDQPAPMATPGQ